jgi:hypothetical protein
VFGPWPQRKTSISTRRIRSRACYSTLFAAFAEFERELIRERVIPGIRNAKINGKSIGRPKRVFPWDEALARCALGASVGARSPVGLMDVPMSTVSDACKKRTLLQE